MDLRKIREQLGYIRVYYLKGDTLRALGSAIMALRDLSRAGNLPTELRSMVREGVGYLARDEELKRHLKRPLAYQPGQEKALFLQLGAALILGQRLVAQGKFSEAEEAFREAVSCYRDEHRLFQMIAGAFMEAGQPRRAIDYLRRAVEVEPDNAAARDMLEEVSAGR